MRKMKIKMNLIFITIFAITYTSISQTNNEIEAIVKDIKIKYTDVNKNAKKAVEKKWEREEDSEFEGASYYFFNNELIKVKYGFNGGGDCGESHEFYYFKGKLFFYFYKSECYGGEFLGGFEKRCYFNNGKMVKFLDKNLKPKKEINVNSKSEEFIIQEKEIFEKEKEVLAKQKKAK